MEKVIFNIRDAVRDLINSSKKSIKTELDKKKYDIQSKIYSELIKAKTISEIISFTNNLVLKSKGFQKKYSNTLLLHSNEKDENKKKELYNQLEIEFVTISSYNEIISLINKYLKNMNEKSKKDRIIEEMNNSSQVIDLLSHYLSLDEKSEEAERLEYEIYKLRKDRQEKIESLISYGSSKYIFEIESLELNCARLRNINIFSGNLSLEQFLELLKSSIKKINSYDFSDNKTNKIVNEYIEAVSNFKNLLKSIDMKDDEIDSLLTDIIRFNLDGDYRVFENINGFGFSKKDYNIKVNGINQLLDSIYKACERKIDSNGIKVINTLETEKDIISRIDSIFKSINDEYRNIDAIEEDKGVYR